MTSSTAATASWGADTTSRWVELDISSSSILVIFRWLQHQVEVKVKRSNSKAHTKPSVAQREFFEQIDSGWTSRDSSSMDRSEYCAVIG